MDTSCCVIYKLSGGYIITTTDPSRREIAQCDVIAIIIKIHRRIISINTMSSQRFTLYWLFLFINQLHQLQSLNDILFFPIKYSY